MENKKIDVLFGLVVIAFLVATLILIKDIRVMRTNDYKEYIASIGNIVKSKNDKIRFLANRLMNEQRENADLKNTLAETRNDLEALSSKLAQQAPAAVTQPAAAPTPAPATAGK